MGFTVTAVRFFENGDEHGRNVLEKIFGIGVLENFSVLLQLVGDLVNDKPAAGRERVIGLLEKFALLVDLKNAKRNARDDVIAPINSAPAQFEWQMGGVIIDDMDPRIVHELTPKVARKSGVEFKEQQLAIRSHPSGALARMHTFARAVLGNHPGALEIDLVRNAFDQRLGAGHD